MARYFALADRTTRRVTQVIVVESAELAAQLVPGTEPSDWIETFPDHATARYAGIGDTFDGTRQERFVEAETRRPGRRSS